MYSSKSYLCCSKPEYLSSLIATINKTQLKNFPVLLPPIHLQQKFTDFVQLLNSTKQNYQELYKQTENLFNSLLQRAFKGEL